MSLPEITSVGPDLSQGAFVGMRRRTLFTGGAGAFFLASTLTACESAHSTNNTPTTKNAHPTPTRTKESLTPSGLITIENGQFYRNGKPFGLFGTNCYPLINNTGEYCGPTLNDVQRKQEMQTATQLGMNVIRFWDFSVLNNNGHDLSATNNVLQYATDLGMVIYPTLTNEWTDCDGSQAPHDSAWYQSVVDDFSNYKNTGKLTSGGYLEYIATTAQNFKGNPNVFAFQLGNELECPDPVLLKKFASAGRKIVKGIDPDRLVTVGVLGSGQNGSVNGDFKSLMEVCDFADIHIYPESGGTTNDLPGDQWNGVAVRMQQAATIGPSGIPILVSEFGIPTGTRDLSGDRETLTKLLTYPNFAGVLAWGLNTPGFQHTDSGQDFEFNLNSNVVRMYEGFANKLTNPALRPRRR